ncbi:MAG TPA: ABC transporter permease, partial [Acetobacteraceae bacterium]
WRPPPARAPMLKIEPRGHESQFWGYASPILALLLTGATSGLIFLIMGKPPGRTVYTFLITPLLQQGGIEALLVKAAPLIMMGVGLSLAYRANVWNIGTDGQFTLGAICGGGIGLAFPDQPMWLLFPAMLIVGTIGGMASGGLVAWLRIRFNANEILTSLMLTYVTQYLLLYLVTGPWRDPQGFGFPQTAQFSDAASGPRLIADSNVHLGILLAPLIAIALWVMLEKSLLGFQFRVLGQATRAARFAGFSENRLVWIAMLISGGLAGMAGLLEATGTLGQLTTQVSPGYGFTAIIVAFLGRLNPLGAIPAGLLLALTYLGGDAAQINLGLPNAVTGIFQGILLFYLLGCDFLLLHRIRWRAAPVRPA